MMDTKDTLLKEIEVAFPFVEMPLGTDLLFHDADCEECKYLLEDLEQYRNQEIVGETIRLVHQELSLLSAKAWQWMLPHYLRYCLTPEAEYNQMEIQFLIYNLGPDKEFESDTSKRLSRLTKSQIVCLIHFLEWCLTQQYWKEFCPESLYRGIEFLQKMSERTRVTS